MNNPYGSGTADWWYSGQKADLWCEYKYIPKLPARNTTLIRIPELFSELQLDWLSERRQEGRNVCAIVGCPLGGVVFVDSAWERNLLPDTFRGFVLTRDKLALWIVSKTVPGTRAHVETVICRS